jgi:hypothetical protein
MGAAMKLHFRTAAKVCSVAIVVLLRIGALGPANWTPRTALGWEVDRFLGYFAITLLVCFAWPRPLAVRGVLMAAAFLLEGLQAFTPDRTATCCVPIIMLLVIAALGPEKWAPHALRLAVRPPHRLFRNHVVCLCRLAPTISDRGSLRGSRGPA